MASGYPDLDDLMTTYQVDYQNDVDLKGLDANLTAGAKEVMEMSDGLMRFKGSVVYLRNSDKKTVETIMSCKTQIHAAKGHEATAIEKFLDQFLIKQYLENSKLTLDICEVYLPAFIRKADKVASCIEDAVRERRMLRTLKTANDSYHRSAQEIAAKIVSLQTLHLNYLNQLKREFKRLDKKLKLIRTVRKVVHVIFIGVLSAVFACSIMATAMAASPGIATFISPVMRVGHHWLLNRIRRNESTLQTRQNLNASMQSGTKDAIKVLEDIMHHADKVIASWNDPQLSNRSVKQRQMNFLHAKLEKFKKEIRELDRTRKEGIPVIKNARDKVLREYGRLKRTLGQRMTRN